MTFCFGATTFNVGYTYLIMIYVGTESLNDVIGCCVLHRSANHKSSNVYLARAHGHRSCLTARGAPQMARGDPAPQRTLHERAAQTSPPAPRAARRGRAPPPATAGDAADGAERNHPHHNQDFRPGLGEDSKGIFPIVCFEHTFCSGPRGTTKRNFLKIPFESFLDFFQLPHLKTKSLIQKEYF